MTPSSSYNGKTWKNLKTNYLEALEKTQRTKRPKKAKKKQKSEESHSLNKIVGKNYECVAFS